MRKTCVWACLWLLAAGAILAGRPIMSYAGSAPANQTTPPAVHHWPTLSISGSFDPKKITNPNVSALWTVDTKGLPRDVRLQKTSGSKDVDNAILHYVRALRFTPAMRDGKPVECRMSHTFVISAGG